MTSQKSAVIVGGSRGIGLAVAQALATRGETVVVTSRDQERAEAAARRVLALMRSFRDNEFD